MAYLVFYITCSNETEAQRLAVEAVEKRLAACANIFPVSSCYWWQGVVQHDAETLLILKTAQHLEQELEACIAAAHSYTTPCIARFEIRANAAYEEWVVSSVKL